MVTVQKLDLHLVDICSLVQKKISRFVAERSRFVAERSQFVKGPSRFAAGRSRFVTGHKDNKSGAKCGAGADSRPEPRTKFNAMSKKDHTL